MYPLPPIFNVVRQFWKIDGNSSLSKHNIEAEFKADFFQTLNVRIVPCHQQYSTHALKLKVKEPRRNTHS